MLHFNFDEEKAISAILYIAEKILALNDIKIKSDFHKIFKILYFADKKQIAKYGRPILGDHYIAMSHGPVPSRIYDMLKIVRGESIITTDRFDKYFDVKDYYIYPKTPPDLDVFSEAELECIEESFEEYHSMGFYELREKSHDNAYHKATKNDKISFREMAKTMGADNSLIAYMRTVSENERLFQ